jgi:hypothetical protein
MKKSRKILIGILCLLIFCGTFMIGAFIGWGYGYAYRAYQVSIGDSYLTMRKLEMLKSDDISGVEKQLESDLDVELIEHWSGLVNKPLYISLLPQNESATNKLMAKVVAYRKANPTTMSDPKVKEAIATVIKRYDK